ncbi:membrane progestin receptor alpha-like [Pecten maximus]|uniref:membrane progestin receptor alpha-like n=1 Tax=Pecten maximus TaxID=6579 RepID=UPI001458298D|nr:membrane progestin receptor alpha-like [Pecten maximus]
MMDRVRRVKYTSSLVYPEYISVGQLPRISSCLCLVTTVVKGTKKMKFPDSPPTLTLAERMPSEICKKHILTGYRRPHQPWSYYVISVFHANNQTLNVWTHVIGFLFIAYRAYDISLTFDMLHDPMFRPLGAGLLCILTLLAASSFAHTFGDKSEVAHYTCFCMDFDAIGIYSMGCALLSHTYFTRDTGLGKFSSQMVETRMYLFGNAVFSVAFLYKNLLWKSSQTLQDITRICRLFWLLLVYIALNTTILLAVSWLP